MKRIDTQEITNSIGYAIPSYRGVAKKRFLLTGYLTFFILGCVLFPEISAALAPGFLFLLLGAKSVETEQTLDQYSSTV